MFDDYKLHCLINQLSCFYRQNAINFMSFILVTVFAFNLLPT